MVAVVRLLLLLLLFLEEGGRSLRVNPPPPEASDVNPTLESDIEKNGEVDYGVNAVISIVVVAAASVKSIRWLLNAPCSLIL